MITEITLIGIYMGPLPYRRGFTWFHINASEIKLNELKESKTCLIITQLTI